MPNPISIALATQLLFLTSSIVASLLFYIRTKPTRSELAITVGGAAVLSWQLGLVGTSYARVMVAFCYLAVTGFALTAVVPFVRPHELAKRKAVLVQMLVPPALTVSTALALALSQGLTPDTFDYYLYAADSGFGGQVGFAAGRLLAREDWLRLLAECAYINLPLAVVTGYLAIAARSELDAWGFVKTMVLLGVVGWVVYIVFPAAGSIVVFADRFPFHPPALADVSVWQTPRVDEPRNCMPSLHAAWGFMLWWACPPSRTFRTGVLAYLAFMLLYTIACGHYVVDIIAAVPFTLSIDAASRFNTRYARRIAVLAMAIFLGWLLLIRFTTDLLLLSIVVPWACAVATLVACWILRRRLVQEQAAGTMPAISSLGTN